MKRLIEATVFGVILATACTEDSVPDASPPEVSSSALVAIETRQVRQVCVVGTSKNVSLALTATLDDCLSSTTECNPKWAAFCELKLAESGGNQIELEAASAVERFTNMNCNSDCGSYSGYCELRGIPDGNYTLLNNGRSVELSIPAQPECFDFD